MQPGNHDSLAGQNFILLPALSGAREAVEAERRLYETGAAPYADETSKDQILAAAVSRIEQEEMAGWVKVAVARPKP
jgi:hypothetical protein